MAGSPQTYSPVLTRPFEHASHRPIFLRRMHAWGKQSLTHGIRVAGTLTRRLLLKLAATVIPAMPSCAQCLLGTSSTDTMRSTSCHRVTAMLLIRDTAYPLSQAVSYHPSSCTKYPVISQHANTDRFRLWTPSKRYRCRSPSSSLPGRQRGVGPEPPWDDSSGECCGCCFCFCWWWWRWSELNPLPAGLKPNYFSQRCSRSTTVVVTKRDTKTTSVCYSIRGDRPPNSSTLATDIPAMPPRLRTPPLPTAMRPSRPDSPFSAPCLLPSVETRAW